MTNAQQIAAYELRNRDSGWFFNLSGACFCVASALAQDATGVNPINVRSARTWASQWTWPDPAINRFEAIRDAYLAAFDALGTEDARLAALEAIATGDAPLTLDDTIAASAA